MMREPTGQECSDDAPYEHDGRRGIATWYPQMGGYVGKCVVLFDAGGCFDVFVWHDGEWPFGADRAPIELHHCDPEQFVTFGETVKAAAKDAAKVPR